MKFEKGDILFAEYNKSEECNNGYIAICSSEYNNSMDRLVYDVMLSVTGVLLFDSSCNGGDFRLATDSEKQLIIDALAKENKYYCEKTKTIKKMKKEFTKKDLKSGMWVENREGNIYLVLFNCDAGLYGSQKICFVRDGYFMTSDKYDEELLFNEGSSFDIIRVYYHGSVGGNTLKFEGTPLIWERETEEDKKVKEMQIKLEEMKKAYNELEKNISETIDKLKGLKK